MLHIEIGGENEVLRKVAEPIKTTSIKKYVKLGQEMIKYIKNPKHGGVGLAAPQVGHSRRLIVVSLLKDRDDEEYKTVMMINPEIVDHSEEKEIDMEGCLSVPGEQGEVARWHMIKLVYLDEKGQVKRRILEGLSARIVQHEIDHLDGVLFTDKVIEKNRLSL